MKESQARGWPRWARHDSDSVSAGLKPGRKYPAQSVHL